MFAMNISNGQHLREVTHLFFSTNSTFWEHSSSSLENFHFALQMLASVHSKVLEGSRLQNTVKKGQYILEPLSLLICHNNVQNYELFPTGIGLWY